MFDFEPIREDVGLELKITAENIYTRTLFVVVALAVVELIASLVMAVAAESFGMFIVLMVVIAVETLIILGIARLLAMKLYAKGEMVHLLRDINMKEPVGTCTVEQTHGAKQAVPQAGGFQGNPATAEEIKNDENFWYCSTCGTKNSNAYGQCKRCASYRGSN